MLKTIYNYENLVEIIDTDIPWIKIRSVGDDGHPYLSYELLVFNPFNREFEITAHGNGMTNLLPKHYYRTPSYEDIDISKHYDFLHKFNIKISEKNIEDEFYTVFDELANTQIDDRSYKTVADLISEYWLEKLKKKINKIVYSYFDLEKLDDVFEKKYSNCIKENKNRLLYSYWVPKNKTSGMLINYPWNSKYVNTQIMVSNINEFLENIPDDCEEIFIPIDSKYCYIIHPCEECK